MERKRRIVVSDDIKQGLRKYGRFGESDSDVIVRLLSHADSCDRFVEDWF